MVIRRTLAWMVWVAGLGLVLYGASVTEEGSWGRATLTLSGMTFGGVGVVLATRTRHVMGWLFIATQMSMGMTLAGLRSSSGLLMLLVAAILLTFPTGGLPSPRWRFAAWSLAAGGVAWVAFDLLQLGRGNDYAWPAFMLLVVPVIVVSGVRIVGDWRSGAGDTRQQLKWLAWVLVMGGPVLLISLIPLPYIGDAHELAGLVLLVGSPVAIGGAVSKYRLYDIDRLISRTLSYTIVIAAIGLPAVAMAAVIGTRFNDPLMVAIATLATALAFKPLRTIVQGRVDRRFYRSRYDAERILAEFVVILQTGVDADELVQGCVKVVVETLHPTAAGMWMREQPRRL